MIHKFNQIISAKIFRIISCLVIFFLSIFLRSIIDIGPDTGIYLDLGKKVAQGGRYYYDFFESNFPLSFYFYAAQYRISLFFGISPIITSEIVINSLALLSIYWSAQILKKSTIANNPAHYNLIIISYFLSFFWRANVIQLGEFGTKTSLLLLCLFPYISFSFERKSPFSKSELIGRGIMMGLMPCLKPHYLVFSIFIEFYKFWQKKSLRTCSKSRCDESEMVDLRAPQRSVLKVREQRSAANPPFTAVAGRDFEQVLKFFLELDKLVMALVGALYLFLMTKLTPEFFEFIVPMWPKVYKAYDNSRIFFENALMHLGAQVVIFSFIFLIFSRLKFSPNDKILVLLFGAASTLIILENIGTIDQLAVFYSVATVCFLKLTYDLILSGKFSFNENKFIILVLLIWPAFDMEILPISLFSLSGFVNVWWLVVLVYPFLFCRKIKLERPQEWPIFKAQELKLVKIIALISIYLVLLFTTGMSLKYLGAWGFIVTNLASLFLVLFFFEKIYGRFFEKFSPFFVFTVTTSISCLLYAYIAPLSNLMPTKIYDTFPNKLSDGIAHYSKIYAPKKEDGFLVLSDFIGHQFPVMNYLEKENYHKYHIVAAMAERGLLGNSTAFPQTTDKDAIFTFSYIFEDLKRQIRNKNVKILFVNSGQKVTDRKDRCLIGFLEYYFWDPEFKKIFLQNFRYENHILTSREVAKPAPRIRSGDKEKSDIFNQMKPSKEVIRYNFEVYVRKQND